MKWLRSLPLLLCMTLAVLQTQSASAQENSDCTGTESWISAAGGLSGEALAATVWNDELYVVHRTGTPASGNTVEHRLSKLSGGSWTEVTTFPVELVDSAVYINHIPELVPYNGSLYMGGEFTAVNGVPGTRAIARWDGSSWNGVMTDVDMAGVKKIEEYQGELYIIVDMGPARRMNLLRGDGTTWSEILGNDYFMDLAAWNGHLYASGYLMGKEVRLARWDGSNWTELLDVRSNVLISKMLPYNNGILFSGSFPKTPTEAGEFAHWNGTALNVLPRSSIKKWLADMDMVEYQGGIYTTTMDSIFQNPAEQVTAGARWDGSQWHTVTNMAQRANFLIVHNDVLYAGGPITSSCGTPLNNIAQLCDDRNCSRISGEVYYDENSNCVKDAGETGRKRRIIEMSPGSTYAISDENGNYAQYVEPGTYTLALRPFYNWNRTCPADPGTYTVTVNTPGASSAGNDFAMQPIPGIQDLRISMMTGNARQGRQLVYVITYENVGATPMNGTVRLLHDPIVWVDSADVPVTRYKLKMAEWDFSDLKMEESRTIKVYTTVAVAAQVGSNICAQVEIDPQSNDVRPDNRDSTCTPVTGSYDPNDIRVTPYGVAENGIIAPEENVLTYHVRFQNTGNDTAFKVVVTDQLSPNLDIASIRLGAASHPYSFSINMNNVLTWTFDDIMLPDSNASEVNSHGFFKFSVNLKPNLAYGTEIPNHVDIYFDYNAPVRTNTVVSIIGGLLGVDPIEMRPALHLYPNPARDMIHLDGELRYGTDIVVRNILGVVVQRSLYRGAGRMTIDASALPAGTYLLEAETSKGRVVQRFSVVK